MTRMDVLLRLRNRARRSTDPNDAQMFMDGVEEIIRLRSLVNLTVAELLVELNEVKEWLRRYEAACGHLPPELVAKALDDYRRRARPRRLTADECESLRAASFEVEGEA